VKSEKEKRLTTEDTENTERISSEIYDSPWNLRCGNYLSFFRSVLSVPSVVKGSSPCKTVFTQRLKQSGMRWKLQRGEWIVDVSVVQFSRIWFQVYQAYLQAKMLPGMGTQAGFSNKASRLAPG